MMRIGRLLAKMSGELGGLRLKKYYGSRIRRAW